MSTPVSRTTSTLDPSWSEVSGASLSSSLQQFCFKLTMLCSLASLIGNGQAPCHKWMGEVMNDYVATGKIKPTELFVSHRSVSIPSLASPLTSRILFLTFLSSDCRISIDDIAKCYTLQDKHDEKYKIMKPFVYVPLPLYGSRGYEYEC